MSDIIRPSINENKESFTPDGVIISKCILSDNGDISGFTPNNVKAKYIYSKNQWFFGKDIGFNNLINLTERTEDERKEIYLKSQEARAKNKENKKNIQEIAKSMLEMTMSKAQIDSIVGGDISEILEDNSVASVLVGSMIKSALEGSFKAFEAVRDTAGYKPKNEVEIQADIMTESDRMLIDKVSKVG